MRTYLYLLTVLVLALSACAAPAAAPAAEQAAAPAEAAAPAAPAAEGVSLSIHWFAWQPCDLLNEISKDYTKETGVKIEVLCTPYPQWHDRVFTDFAARGGTDMIVIDSQWVGEAVVGGHLVELTDWMKANLDLSDFSPQALQAYGEYPFGSGKYYGVALEQDTEVLFYRKDLFADPKEQEAFKAKYGRDLTVPKTWSELLEVAQFFYRPEQGLYGFATKWDGTKGSDVAATDWNHILWSFGGELWDPETMQIEGVLNNEVGVKALQFAQELFKTAAPGAGKFSFTEVNETVCTGSTVMGINWFGFMPATTDPASCAQAANIGYAVVPGEVEHYISLGGMGITLSNYSKNKEQALDYLKWLFSKDTQWKWARGGGFTPLLSILNDPEFTKLTPYNHVFPESIPLVRDFWNLPEYAQMLEIQQEYLNLAITGQMDAKEALDTIARKQQEIIDAAYPDRPKP